MRRKDREVTDFNKILQFIDECEIVRLGLADGDFPYIVPMNFGYSVENGQVSLYVHGAMAGRRFELLQKNPVCSVELDNPIEMDFLYDAKDVTMRYRSVMAKAKAVFIEGPEKKEAMDKYVMGRREDTKNFDYNQASLERMAMIRLDLYDITAKENPVREK